MSTKTELKTKPTTKTEKKSTLISAENDWFLFDAKDRVLGRLSTRVATALMGKEKATWTPNKDPKISVVVINSDKVVLTGKKEKKKNYFNYSGYPGGLKTTSARKMREEKSGEIIYHSVRGMLPKNKLASRMIARLFVYKAGSHPHEAQKPIEVKN